MQQDALLTVLRETRQLLANPANSFEWSSWDSAEAALREFDALIRSIASGAPPNAQQLAVLFAPTGPVQEVSLSSGWGEQFLHLADRVDAAMR